MMTRNILQPLICLFGICLMVSPCIAQEKSKVSLQFLTFPKSSEPLKIQLLEGEAKTTDLEVSSNELTQPIDVSRMTTWVFGETLNDKDGKPYFHVHGQAPALTAQNQLILLVRKGAQTKDGIEVIPITNDVNSLGGGKFFFMNAAKVEVAGDVGGVKFGLKPDTHKIISPNPDKTGRLFHALFFYRNGENPKPFFSSTWPYNKKGRSFVFFYHHPKTKRLAFHTIRDYSL